MSTPPDRPCHDGDQEWRPVGSPKGFSIRSDGPRTGVAFWTDPQIEGLQDWVGQSPASIKDHLEPISGHKPISVVELDHLSANQLIGWLRGVGSSSTQAVPNLDFHFRIHVKQRTVACRQRWVCRNGAWQALEVESVVDDFDLPDQFLDDYGVEPTPQKVQGFLTRIRALVAELKKNEEAAERAKRCG